MYDKGLFTSQSRLSGLYRPCKDIDVEEQLDQLLSIGRLRSSAGMGFAGATEWAEPRDRNLRKMVLGKIRLGWTCFLQRVKKGKNALNHAS